MDIKCCNCGALVEKRQRMYKQERKFIFNFQCFCAEKKRNIKILMKAHHVSLFPPKLRRNSPTNSAFRTGTLNAGIMSPRTRPHLDSCRKSQTHLCPCHLFLYSYLLELWTKTMMTGGQRTAENKFNLLFPHKQIIRFFKRTFSLFQKDIKLQNVNIVVVIINIKPSGTVPLVGLISELIDTKTQI